jgi:hypothetical protein
VLAVPEPVGGRLPAILDDAAGGFAPASVGVGGTFGASEGGMAGFEVTVAWMGPVGTPATTVLSTGLLSSA